jgi:hypothetical protein
VHRARPQPPHQLADAVLDADPGGIYATRQHARHDGGGAGVGVEREGEHVVVEDRQPHGPGLDRDVLALADAHRRPHRLGHQGGERVTAGDADDQSRARQVVADPAEDGAAEGDGVEAVVEAAGDVDQLPDQPLRVVVRREGVRLLVERGVQERADQAEAQAGHAPAEGSEPLRGAEPVEGDERDHHDRGELGRECEGDALERAVEPGGERRDREGAEHGQRAVDRETADGADHRRLDGDDEHDGQPLAPVGQGAERPDRADGDQGDEAGRVLRPQHGAEERDEHEGPRRGGEPDVLTFANPHLAITCC